MAYQIKLDVIHANQDTNEPYIYYIINTKTKECYIGQTIQSGSKRILDHFDAVYTNSSSKSENNDTLDMILHSNLKDIEIYVFNQSSNYGLSEDVFDKFFNIFVPSGEVLRNTTKENFQYKKGDAIYFLNKQGKMQINNALKIDAAEILHIINMQNSGFFNLKNKDMGGAMTSWTLVNQDIRVLEKDTSPAQALSVFNKNSEVLGKIQEILDDEIYQLLHSDKWDNWIKKFSNTLVNRYYETNGKILVSEEFNNALISEYDGFFDLSTLKTLSNRLNKRCQVILPGVVLHLRSKKRNTDPYLITSLGRWFKEKLKKIDKVKVRNIQDVTNEVANVLLTKLYYETKSNNSNVDLSFEIKDIIDLEADKTKIPSADWWKQNINFNKPDTTTPLLYAIWVFENYFVKVKDSDIYQRDGGFYSKDANNDNIYYKPSLGYGSLSVRMREYYQSKGIKNDCILNWDAFYGPMISILLNSQGNPWQLTTVFPIDEKDLSHLDKVVEEGKDTHNMWYRLSQTYNDSYIGHRFKKINTSYLKYTSWDQLKFY